MKDEQWNLVKKAAACEEMDAVPAGLIVDSPWMPGYCGVNTMDFYTDPAVWHDCYRKVKEDFPELILFPDYWIEFGMASEPSSFGCKMNYYPNQPVCIQHLIDNADDIDRITGLEVPNPQVDGMMPLALNYYRNLRQRLEGTDEKIRMVAARGPLNVASFLMSVPEFCVAVKVYPDELHQVLECTTQLVIRWLNAQMEAAGPDVEGILVLDDLCGFLTEEDYLEFAQPYLKRIFDTFDVPVKMFHNDNFGNGYTTFPYIHELGINIFNFSHMADLTRARELLGDSVCILGNLAPRDILTYGTPESVREATLQLLDAYGSTRGILFSAGGGASPGMNQANCRAMLDALQEWNALTCH